MDRREVLAQPGHRAEQPEDDGDVIEDDSRIVAGCSGSARAGSIPAASIASSPAASRLVPRTAQPSSGGLGPERPPAAAAADDQRPSH